MKTETLLMLGGLGLLAWLVLKKDDAAKPASAAPPASSVQPAISTGFGYDGGPNNSSNTGTSWETALASQAGSIFNGIVGLFDGGDNKDDLAPLFA